METPILLIAGAIFCFSYWYYAFKFMKGNPAGCVPKTRLEKILFFFFWWVPLSAYALLQIATRIIGYVRQKGGIHHV